MKQRRVAMSYELLEIADAIEAARMLGDAISTTQLGSEHDQRNAPRALTAVLNIVGARLKDVTRVLRGDVDPATIHTHYNGVEASIPGETILRPWTTTNKGAR